MSWESRFHAALRKSTDHTKTCSRGHASLGDARTFFERIERPGSADSAMREFVKTFTNHLGSGAANDEEKVWKLLQRLHIFVFDFTAPGSVSEDLARERAVRVLHPEDGLSAGAL